jgi:polar amino acid transport system ATP-binding protein
VDLTARAGDVVSLIGSSGSGKSTLLRCANLLEDSQQGEILFEGEPVSRGAEPAVRAAPPMPNRSAASARTCRWCSSSSTSGRT